MAQRPDTPFILVTGAVTEDRAIDILTQGAKDYVLKNRLEQRLVPAVRRALAEAEEHRARKQAEEDLRSAHKELEDKVRERTAALEAEIEERKRAEEAMNENRHRLAAALEIAALSVWEYRQDTGLIEFDQRSSEIFGTGDRRTMSIEDFLAFVGEEDRERVAAAIASAFDPAGNGLYETEYRIIRFDGTERWLAARGQALFKNDGQERQLVRAVGTAMDITLRKQAEEDLRQSREDLERAQMVGQVGSWRLDTRQNILTWSDENHRIFGLPKRTPMSYETFLGTIHPDDRQYVDTQWQAGLRGAPYDIEHRIVVAGKVKWVREKAYLEFDASGQLLGGFGITQDITARKQAEIELLGRTRQLEDADRELESFSYSVSHDLRAPLRAIDGFSKKLEREFGNEPDAKVRRTIGVIRQNAATLGTLIDDLLAFSRVQKTKMSLAEIEMDQLVREIGDELQAANQDRKLSFKITGMLPAFGDRVLIRQVLFNLLSNAVKFTKNRKQGIIEISSYRDADRMVYCVKDNGAGFDMAYADKLFGIFQRLHGADEYEGTGAGLAIVQRIIKRHGGAVWAEGKVDKGATFYFSLPLDTQKCDA